MTIQLKQYYILDVQDRNLPCDIIEAIKYIASEYYELPNDSYFDLDEDVCYEDADINELKYDFSEEYVENTLLIKKFLNDNGFNEKEVKIYYWW